MSKIWFCFLIGPACLMASSGSIEVVAAAKRIAIVLAIDPAIQAHNIGLMAFRNQFWTEKNIGLDVNAQALASLEVCLNREAKKVDGWSAEFPVSVEEKNSGRISQKELTAKLPGLGKKWEVDAILVMQSGETRDWLGSTRTRLEGFGLYDRGPHEAAYSVLELSVFDCGTQRLSRSKTTKRAQTLPRVEWYDDWQSYLPHEKRVILRGLEDLVKSSVAALLSEVGLATAPPNNRSMLSKILLVPDLGEEWLPKGNELPIPEGVSARAARPAVIAGMVQRGWTVTQDSKEYIVCELQEKKKISVATATLSEREIIIVPERFEILADGSRKKIEPHLRWHRNLKESILRELFKVTPEPTPSESIP